MATVTGLTAERMLEIEGASVVDAEIIDGDLILTKHDGTTINAGNVEGPAGTPGPVGPEGGSIPGEVKLWPGDELPLFATYGTWVWADGAVYVVADHPIAADHIATGWRTFAGASDPGGSNFRVPDLRGLVPAGMDGMPGGTRANRMTRAVAITLAGRTGEETHVITVPEMAGHVHGVTDPGHRTDFEVADGGTILSGLSSRPQLYFRTTSDVDNLVHTIPESDRAATLTGISIQNSGGNGAHENVQPTVFVPYIVKLDD